ncbi:MAG: phenylacetate--CoA ligase family protein, partial [Veillonellaceae bacterium]|nr:phenylacetate--CoA ligase family protein [Veillonellaceae bacterium]
MGKMPDLVGLYHRFPYPLRVLAASLRGYQLHWWRYSHETDRLVGEAVEREYWSADQWAAWREERLAQLLQRAAMTVPYYQRFWQNQRRVGNRSSWELLENWPILTKEELRAYNRDFVAIDCDLARMYCEHTSGTTGTPLHVWLKRETLVQWYAIFEARWRGWYGLSRKDRWAILGGQLVTPVTQRKSPYWVWNAGLQQLYFSTYHLSESSVADYVRALSDHRITYLWGYASVLAALAQYIQEKGQQPPELRRVISNAEPLFDFQRNRIAEVFKCPVVDTYGMAEMVSAASECDYGTFHLWPEVGITEVFCDDVDMPEAKGQVGRLICTGLLNLDMPLI